MSSCAFACANLFLNPFASPRSKNVAQLTIDDIVSHMPYRVLSTYDIVNGTTINDVRILAALSTIDAAIFLAARRERSDEPFQRFLILSKFGILSRT